jgi:solute:Na+ symporter, SSS family
MWGTYRFRLSHGLAIQLLIPCGAAYAGDALAKAEATFGVLDYIAIGLYLLVIVGLGAYFAKREKSTERFFLGGRNLPWWAVGISIFSTGLSAITYLSFPAKAFDTNWVMVLPTLGTLIMAPVVVFYYLPHYRRAPITTAYEYLEKRFNLAARLYGTVVFALFQAGRVSIILLLPALALSAATGVDVTTCIVGVALFSILYTSLGGIEVVVWSDVIQAAVLLFGAILALVIIIMNVDGGLSGVVSTGVEHGKFHMFDFSFDLTAATVWVCVMGSVFAYAYPSTADQTIVQRYLATPDERTAARAVWTNALVSLPITLIFFGLGTALFAFYNENPKLLDDSLQRDAILPLFILQKFPPGLGGLVIAGIFAAAMSSLDSSMNSVSTVVVNDYFKRFYPDASDRTALRLARVVVVVFGVLCMLWALWFAKGDDRSVLDRYFELLGLVTGGLAGLFALGVFTKRANGFGGLCGIVASSGALYAVREFTEAHYLTYGAVGFLTCFVVGYVASLFVAAPRDPH